MSKGLIQVYRLVPEGVESAAVGGTSGRYVTMPAADPSPITESHRGAEFSSVETWLVDSVLEANAVRSQAAEDGSIWVTTRRHVVLNGSPLTRADAAFGIKMVVGMCRLEGTSIDDFQQHWLSTHADLTLTAPGTSRYEIALPVVDEYEHEAPVYDGFAELWWRSQADLDAYMTSPVMGQVGIDMETFVSPVRPLFSVFSTVGETWS